MTTKEPHMSFGHVGMELMASLLKARGHEVIGIADTMFDASPRMSGSEASNLSILKDFNPNFIGFGVLTHRYQWCLKFARLIKKELPDAKIVFGGPQATVAAHIIKAEEKCVDFVVRGEGEHAILELIENPDRTDILNVYPNPMRPLIQDLDSLPFPDKSIWIPHVASQSEFSRYMIMTSRGCPYRCCYCFNSAYSDMLHGLGKYVRFRSPENVIRELEFAKKAYDLSFVLFMDDNLSIVDSWFREFAEKYRRRISVPYVANAHPNTLNEEKIRLLKESDCRFIMMGVQTGCNYARKTFINRPESNQQIRRIARLCKQYGLGLTFDHIFGIPEADRFLRESATFYNEVRPDSIATYRHYYLPETPMFKRSNLSQEAKNQIYRGLFQAGTIRADRNKSYVAYRNLFVVLPLLPKSFVHAIINSRRLLKLTARLPELLVFLAKALTNLKVGSVWLVAQYFYVIPTWIRFRLRGYYGEFQIPKQK